MHAFGRGNGGDRRNTPLTSWFLLPFMNIVYFLFHHLLTGGQDSQVQIDDMDIRWEEFGTLNYLSLLS